MGRVGDRRTLADLRDLGRRGRSGVVTVRFLAEPDAPRPRVAFAIGRHVGTAVVRNRVRRRLRASLGTLAADTALPAGAYLVAAGPTAATVPFGHLHTMVTSAVRTATAPRPEAGR